MFNVEIVRNGLPQLISALPCFGPHMQGKVVAACADLLRDVSGQKRRAQYLGRLANDLSSSRIHLTVSELDLVEGMEGAVIDELGRDHFVNGNPLMVLGRFMAQLHGRRLTPFPYHVNDDGSYRIEGEGRQVVVLGDVGGFRTRELALQEGHAVVFIDFSSDHLCMAADLTRLEARALDWGGQLTWRPDIQWHLDNWYDRQTEAAMVEAFYPAHPGDLSLSGWGPADPAYARRFVRQGLNSKLAPGADGEGVFVVSEFAGIVDMLAEVVIDDAGIVLEKGFGTVPVVGGYGAMDRAMRRASWLVYRPAATTEQPT